MQRAAVDTATAVMQLLQAGRLVDIDDLRAAALRDVISVEALRDPWQKLLTAHGPITSVGAPLCEPVGPHITVVKIPVTCERGAFAVVAMTDQDGGLLGVQFGPPEAAEPVRPWQPPSYADPAGFAEYELTVGCAPLETPGTLSVPHTPRALPAVVLVPGSGPNDRDATMGRNKIFKDLAWGLASRGIAVLRFDKVTHTHHDALADVTEFTVVEEYVRPAVAAVRLLRDHPMVDAGRVFVLGHSQGGTLAPRIAAAEPSVAGLVVLAGGTQPPHRALLRQLRHLATLREPTADPDADPTIQTISRQCALIDSPQLSASTPADQLPLGVPAPYWLDLRDYDPVAVAAQIGKPMLILQGGRDYQVTVTEDLPGWQTRLADRRDVTIRTYPALNHLFFTGSGPSTPAEYEPAQHVEETVVVDIARWVTSGQA